MHAPLPPFCLLEKSKRERSAFGFDARVAASPLPVALLVVLSSSPSLLDAEVAEAELDAPTEDAEGSGRPTAGGAEEEFLPLFKTTTTSPSEIPALPTLVTSPSLKKRKAKERKHERDSQNRHDHSHAFPFKGSDGEAERH